MLEDWVPAEQALEWCSRYGLPATEELAIQVAAQPPRLDTQLALVAYYQPRLFQRYQRELEHCNAAIAEEQRFPNDPTKADVVVRALRILRNTQMQILNFNPATEAQLYIAGMDCLRLDRFQRETAILYWLFQLWKALKDWEPFEASLGRIDSEQAENQRRAIHRYADLLLGLCQAPNRHVLASDVALASAIRAEREVRKSLDRNPDPEVKTLYEETQKHVNRWAETFASDMIKQRLGELVMLSWESPDSLLRARCVFGECYLQLKGLTQKPPGEWARYLRLCEACPNLFWTEHGNSKYCERHPTRQALAMAKKRARR